MSVRMPAEGVFGGQSTVGLVLAAVELLRDGDVVLSDGDVDYAAADMLEILANLHDATGIDLEGLWQVRSFVIAILDGRWAP